MEEVKTLPMEGIKTYRFPTINSSYGQAIPRNGHLRPAVSKVSSCVIDTPRDDGQIYREHLWSFQKHHRGIKSQDDCFPDIPFRLRSNDFGYDDQAMEASQFPCLDSFGSGSFTERSFVRQMTRTRTSIASTDTMPKVSKDAPFMAKGVSMPFTRSLRLCSRERRNVRPSHAGVGSITERLPRVAGLRDEVFESPPLKKSSSLIDVREDGSEDTSSVDSGELRSGSIEIHSYNIGHTTTVTIDTTLADILNRHNNNMYYDLGRKNISHSDPTLNETNDVDCGTDKQWMHKFETKIVDGNLYDNFARTRKPDLEKETTRSELKSVKRPHNQKASANDLKRSADGKSHSVFQKDGYPTRKTEPGQIKKHSKLKLSLTSNRSSD